MRRRSTPAYPPRRLRKTRGRRTPTPLLRRSAPAGILTDLSNRGRRGVGASQTRRPHRTRQNLLRDVSRWGDVRQPRHLRIVYPGGGAPLPKTRRDPTSPFRGEDTPLARESTAVPARVTYPKTPNAEFVKPYRGGVSVQGVYRIPKSPHVPESTPPFHRRGAVLRLVPQIQGRSGQSFSAPPPEESPSGQTSSGRAR